MSPIEKGKSGSIIATGKGVELYALLARKGMVEMEEKGMRRRGRSATVILKEHYGVRTRGEVLEKLEADIEKARDEVQAENEALG